MGGQRLLQRADINIGSHVTSFFRIRAKASGKSSSDKNRDLRQLTYFGEGQTRTSTRGYPVANSLWEKYHFPYNLWSIPVRFIVLHSLSEEAGSEQFNSINSLDEMHQNYFGKTLYLRSFNILGF